MDDSESRIGTTIVDKFVAMVFIIAIIFRIEEVARTFRLLFGREFYGQQQQHVHSFMSASINSLVCLSLCFLTNRPDHHARH